MKSQLTNKELSWLSFNARVLQEAADPSVPLIERIKFLGIFSKNLDEFFRVRVATLKRLSKLGKKAKKFVTHDPKKILQTIQGLSVEQHNEFNRIYHQILKELARENIFILDEKTLSPEQGELVRDYFHRKVRSRLMPIMLDAAGRFPRLKDATIYLAIRLARNDDRARSKFALIEIPVPPLERFVLLPRESGNQYIILLDDVIRYGLKDIFAIFDFQHHDAYTIKLTRDAELAIDDDIAESYLKKVSKSLKQREQGAPVRFVYDSEMPKNLLNYVTKKLRINKADTLVPGARYHNFKDFMSFPSIDSSKLQALSTPPLPHPDLANKTSLLATIRKKDILLHFPYQAFDHFIDLLREVSIDPKVTSIKFTLYRVARQSSVVNTLVNAVKNGKVVTVVIELQARFDEEANIRLANRLQEEGVRVIQGVPGLKVHAKLCLITRTERNKSFRYAALGTGNVNEDTARAYSDHFLLTADRRLTAEVDRVFEFFENNYRVKSFRHLVVAPFNMRKRFGKMIRNEIKNAQKGKPAYVFLKMNNLEDPAMIKQLYQASAAGVKVRLIVRGMFSLVPGVPGLSENIEAISIVDRFLEHSRIFVFGSAGDEKFYLSSADWMTRNFDRRLEVSCPVYDRSIQRELRSFLDIQWRDNVKARKLTPELDNRYRTGTAPPRVRAQTAIHDFLEGNQLPLSYPRIAKA